MYGLETIKHMNQQEVARFQANRYIRIRNKAIAREDWKRAQKFDGWATDMKNFIGGKISVYPNKENRKKGLFQPATGRDFSKLPPGQY